LTAEEAEEDDEHSKEWLNIFSQETEKTATWEFVAEEEEAYIISLADLYEQIEALERRVKVQGVHIQ
jgi:predicted DNA-binding protein